MERNEGTLRRRSSSFEASYYPVHSTWSETTSQGQASSSVRTLIGNFKGDLVRRVITCEPPLQSESAGSIIKEANHRRRPRRATNKRRPCRTSRVATGRHGIVDGISVRNRRRDPSTTSMPASPSPLGHPQGPKASGGGGSSSPPRESRKKTRAK